MDNMKVWMVAGHGDLEGSGAVFATGKSALEYVTRLAYDNWQLAIGGVSRQNSNSVEYSRFSDVVEKLFRHESISEGQGCFYMWAGKNRFKTEFCEWDEDYVGGDLWWTVTCVDFENK